MARRRWDDPWQRYPESVPLPVAGGSVHFQAARRDGRDVVVATVRRRARVVRSRHSHATWPPIRPDRPGRQRRRAPGMLAAQVQGSRPNAVRRHRRGTGSPTDEQWSRESTSACGPRSASSPGCWRARSRPIWRTVFADASVALFPTAWADLDATCSCPDWENPCKHIAAVLYVLRRPARRRPLAGPAAARPGAGELLLDALAGGRTAGISHRRRGCAVVALRGRAGSRRLPGRRRPARYPSGPDRPMPCSTRWSRWRSSLAHRRSLSTCGPSTKSSVEPALPTTESRGPAGGHAPPRRPQPRAVSPMGRRTRRAERDRAADAGCVLIGQNRRSAVRGGRGLIGWSFRVTVSGWSVVVPADRLGAISVD